MPRSAKAQARHSRREARRPARPAVVQKEEANFNAPPKRASREPLVPLTQAQKRYRSAILTNQITYGLGPAGTGKTWFAAALAADALLNGEIEKIIVTRPAVEVDGEKFGFLPGELDEKYAPYLIPVLEAFEERLGTGHLEYCLRKKIIEPRPLAFMRGSTLKNAWVLFDEAQNATKGQFKMLLTRIGENARFVINGDPKQTDIPNSGLMDALRRTGKLHGIAEVNFTKADIVRSGLCQAVVEAYEDD